MGAAAILIMYAIILAVVSTVAYFVIKLAVKAALKEYFGEKERKE